MFCDWKNSNFSKNYLIKIPVTNYPFVKWPCDLWQGSNFVLSGSPVMRDWWIDQNCTVYETKWNPPWCTMLFKFLQLVGIPDFDIFVNTNVMTFYCEYCTIMTLGSQGVTHDGREQYQTKFIGSNFAWWDLNRFTFYPKRAGRPRKTSDLVYSGVHGWLWHIMKCFRCSIQCQLWRMTEPKVIMVQY